MADLTDNIPGPDPGLVGGLAESVAAAPPDPEQSRKEALFQGWQDFRQGLRADERQRYFKDDSQPLPERVRHFLGDRSVAATAAGVAEPGQGEHWKAVSKDIAVTFPGADPEVWRRDYEQMTKLRLAHQKQEGQDEGWGEFFAKRSVPFYAGHARGSDIDAYNEAQKRLQAGAPKPEDYDTIARFDRLRHVAENRSLLGDIGESLAHLPAIAGEAYAAGKVVQGAGTLLGRSAAAAAPVTTSADAAAANSARTLTARAAASQLATGAAKTAATTALMPSMYREEASRRALEKGGQWYELKNLGPAYTLGALQNAVLGSLSKAGGGTAGAGAADWFKTVGRRTATGLAEQSAVDLLAGSVGLQAGYGPVGEILDGNVGEGLRHLTVQATTFAAFGAMHGREPDKMMEAYSNTLKRMKERGVSGDKAAATLAPVFKTLGEAMNANPDLSPAQARRLVEGFEGEAWEKKARGDLAEVMATKPAAEPPPLPKPPKPREPFQDRSDEEVKGIAKGLGLSDKGDRAAVVKRMVERMGEGTVEAMDPAWRPEKAKEKAEKEARAREAFGKQPEAPVDKTQAEAPPVLQPAAPEPPPDTSGPGKPTSDLDPVTQALGMGPALKEVPAAPAEAPRPDPATPEGRAALRLENARRKTQGLAPVAPRPVNALAKLEPLKPALSPESRAAEPALKAERLLKRAGEAASGLRALALEMGVEVPPGEKGAEPPRPGETAADWRLQTIRSALAKSTAEPSPEGVERLTRLVQGLDVIAREKGLDPHELLAREVPELAEKLGPEAVKDMLNLAREIPTDEARDAKRRSLSTEALRRLHGPQLQEEAQAAQIPDPGAGERGGEGAGPPEGPAEAAGAAPGERAPAPAPAERGPAGGDELRGAAEEIRKAHNDWAQEHNKDLADTREMLGGHGKLIHLERYEDPHAIPGLDEAADYWKRHGRPEWGDVNDLLRVLKEGNAKPMGPAEATEQARGVYEKGGPEFGFGANESANPEQWRGASAAPPRPEPVDPVAQIAHDVAKDEAGHLDVKRVRELAAQGVGKVKAAVRHVADNFAELAGEMGPRTTRLNRPTGEALARMNAAPVFAREASPYLIDKVMGEYQSQAARRTAGAVIVERRLRHMRDYYHAEAARLTAAGDEPGARKAAETAAGVATLIGQENSPLPTEAHYQNLLRSEFMKGILERWKEHIVPVMEGNFRRSQGLAPDDAIETATQIPGEPVNLKSLRPDEDGHAPVGTGGGRGNLRNTFLGKLGFSKQAKGSGERYDVDLGAIVENSLMKGSKHAAKADFARTAVENGVAEWGPPGQRMEGMREVPNVAPAAGTQEARRGETSLYVHDAAFPEVHRALATDMPLKLQTVKAFNDVITSATLFSTQEAVTHTKNLLTLAFKPGMGFMGAKGFLGIIKNGYKILTGDAETQKRMVELAEMGAMKPDAFESTSGAAKYNPLHWSGKVLDFVGRTMRLTMDDAFDRLARSGMVPDTETNRRNYINQLGQYNIRAQHRVVGALRDSGLAPFATAGTNFWAQSFRALTGSPGVEATSKWNAARLRMAGLVNVGAVFGAVALANYLRWGRMDGDDKTPIGGLKLGEDADGTQYIDLGALTGVTRGMRQTGLLALAEGSRADRGAGAIMDRAGKDVVHSALHPAMGPPVQFAHTAITGENSLGVKVAPQVSQAATPKGIKKAEELGKPEPGSSQLAQNLLAAVKNANPIVAAALGADQPAGKELTDSRWWKLLGPFGVKTRSTPPGGTPGAGEESYQPKPKKPLRIR